MAEGYNIAPLPAPKLVQMPQIGPPRLLAPGEFAPPLKVEKWDLRGLEKLGQNVGEFISDIFPSEEKKQEKATRLAALEAGQAQAERTTEEIDSPELETQRKLDQAVAIKRAEGDIGYEDNMRTAIIGRYGVKGIKALNAAQLSGKNIHTPEGQSAILDELDNQLPKQSIQSGSGAPPASADVNSILDQQIDTPAQGALAVQQLKELGYDATLSQGAADKLGMKSWKLGIKGYNAPVKSVTTSGIGQLPKTPEGTVDFGSADLSVPLDVSNPLDRLTSSKAKDQMQIKMQTAAQSQLAKSSTNVEEARQRLQEMNEFMSLNQDVGTGGLYNIPGVNAARQLWGGDAARMQSIANKLIPRERVPGMRITNYDLGLFQKATVGLDKPRSTNEAIGKAAILNSQNQIDHYDFLNSYLAQHGNLDQAEQKWSDYENNNPIFDPRDRNAGTTFKLNDNRMPWNDYFKVKNLDVLAKKGVITQDQAEEQKSSILSNRSNQNTGSPISNQNSQANKDLWSRLHEDQSASASQEVTATGPNGQKLKLVNGQWIPMS